MYVRRLHIDRFGILGEQDVGPLSPGLNCFLGRNEAGKSTCLRFFQSMLFGYKRGNRSLDPMPDQRKKAVAGGSLLLHTSSMGDITLTRRPGRHGGQLSLSAASGADLDEQALTRLFGSLTVDVYDAIFALSLKDLMDFSSLSGDSVRHALHGAAFGTGLKSPALILKTLDDRMSALLKRDPATAAINTALRSWEETCEELRARTPDLEQYAALQSRLDELEEELTALRAGQDANAAALRRVRRWRDVWRQAAEIRRVRAELRALDPLPGGELCAPDAVALYVPDAAALCDSDAAALCAPDAAGLCVPDAAALCAPDAVALCVPDAAAEPAFAPDAVQRLDALLAQQEERTLALREADAECERLRAAVAALGDPGPLAVLQPAVQSLREQKERRRKEAEGLTALVREVEQLAASQNAVLDRLGPGWDAAAVLAADISLAAEEALRRHEAALLEARQTLHDRQQDGMRLEDQLAEARRQEEEAVARLEARPLPPGDLPDRTLAAIVGADLARAGSALAALPRLHERSARAADELRRALADISPAWTTDTLRGFDASLHARQRLADHAAALSDAREAEAGARRDVRQAEEALQEPEARYGAAQERLERYGDLPGPEELEERHTLLRRLHLLSFEEAVAQREYASINEALSECLAPPRPETRTLLAWLRQPLPGAGLLLILAGLALAGGGWLAQSPPLYPAGACLLLAGSLAWLLHSRMVSSSTESTFSDVEALRGSRAQALQRRNALAGEVACLAAEAADWLAAARPQAPDEGDLARAARQLEQQGRQLVLRERDAQDAAAARLVLTAAEQRLERAEGAAAEAGAAMQEAEALWQAHLRLLCLDPAMRPEHAGAVFDRVATARARAAAAEEAAAAVRGAEESVSACIAKAAAQPWFFRCLQEAVPDLPASGNPGPGAGNGGAGLTNRAPDAGNDASGVAHGGAGVAHGGAGMAHGGAGMAHGGAGMAGGEAVAANRGAAVASGGTAAPDADPAAYSACLFAPGTSREIPERLLAALDRALSRLDGLEAATQEHRRLALIREERGAARERCAGRLAAAQEAAQAAALALDAASAAWCGWLRSRALPETFSPKAAAAALGDMAAFRSREKESVERAARLEDQLRGLEQFLRQVAALAARAGRAAPPVLQPYAPGGERADAACALPFILTVRDAQRFVPPALGLLDSLGAEVETAARSAARLEQLQEQRGARQQARQRCEAALALVGEGLGALLASAGQPDAEHFRAAFARSQRKEALREQERTLLAALEQLAAEDDLTAEGLLASLDRESPGDLEEEEARLRRELAGQDEAASDLSETRGRIQERRAALLGGESATPLRGREAALREELHTLSRRWAVLALARDILLRAKERFEEEGQEGVIRLAGDLFAAITGGEYSGIAASLDGDAYTALHRSGERRDPEKQLSQGTREQLYLSLRLAYITNHAAKAECVPVVMDDILVNFDPGRAAGTAAVLADFARSNQVLFFTCHPAMAELLLKAGRALADPPPAAFEVSKGIISRRTA